MRYTRDELTELILEAVGDYKDLDPSELDPSEHFADMELEPMDVASIVREVASHLDIEPPRGFEFCQSVEELADFLCQ